MWAEAGHKFHPVTRRLQSIGNRHVTIEFYENGGPCWTRTSDQSIMSRLL